MVANFSSKVTWTEPSSADLNLIIIEVVVANKSDQWILSYKNFRSFNKKIEKFQKAVSISKFYTPL